MTTVTVILTLHNQTESENFFLVLFAVLISEKFSSISLKCESTFIQKKFIFAWFFKCFKLASMFKAATLGVSNTRPNA